jgi:NSS family neurotransmitter:Na+ symporter
MIPLLFIIMGAVVIYSLTLNGDYFGLQTLFTPDFGEVSNPSIWVAAISQILFSLGIDQAIMTIYTSYLSNGAKLTDSVFKVIFANCSFELFAAAGIFSILGFMVIILGVNIHNSRYWVIVRRFTRTS